MSHNVSSLNTQQQDAVLHGDGPCLILAGAGSGKTRTIIHRVAYLLEKGIDPNHILLVTFTNKAAGEMKERISSLLSPTTNPPISPSSHLPFAGTFHSFCAGILRRHGCLIGIPVNYVIYDTPDQKDTIRMAMQKLDISQKQYHPASVLNLISQAKNELISAGSYPQYARGRFQETAEDQILVWCHQQVYHLPEDFHLEWHSYG